MNPLLIFVICGIFSFPVLNGDTTGNNVLPGNSDSLTLYFITGSDWCANCRKFDKKVLSDSGFNNAVKSSGIQSVTLDFPQKKKSDNHYNDSMAGVLGFDGNFPAIYLMNHSNGKKVGIAYQSETANEFYIEIKKAIDLLR